MPDSLSFSTIFGVSRESADLVRIAVAAVRAGYAILPVYPGTKRPMCTLTQRQRQSADREVAEQAKANGHKNWMHARHSCGFTHAITEEKVAQRVFKRLVDAHPDLNLAIEVGRSRVITVDADNAEDVTAFTQMWADEVGVPELAKIKPTVSSPGLIRVDANGESKATHKGGGHFHYLLPDDVDFSNAPTAAGLNIGGAAVYFKDRVLLVPPSVREEGPYVLQSDIGPAPEWLLDAIRRHVEGHHVRAEMIRDRAMREGDPIDAWSVEVPWARLLEEDDWTDSHKFDTCGCTIWTRPGDDWSNPKSATAHEPGCTRWEQDSGHGFLHVWTDDPPDFIRRYIDATGNKSLSKLQYVAWRDYDGVVRDAMRELSLSSVVEKMDPRDILAKGVDVDDPKDEGRDLTPDLIEAAPREGLRARMYTRSELESIPPPVWLIKGWITRDSLSRLSGAPGSYKTFVALDMACNVATGRTYHGYRTQAGKVLYIAAEGVAGIRKRIRAWEVENGVIVPDERFMVMAGAVHAADAGEWAALCAVNQEDGYDLIILDTQARMTAGLDENSNSEMSMFIARMDVLKNQSGAAVLAVHHSGHGQSRGRGASSMWGGMDVELFLDRDKQAGTSTLSFIKSKDSDEDLKFVFKISEHVLGLNEDGEEIKSITLHPTDAPEGEEGIEHWIKVLDNLGVPSKAGRPACAEALRLAGYRIDENKLKEIIKVRKARVQTDQSPGTHLGDSEKGGLADTG